MPILKRELDVFPEELFDYSIEESPWWVAHVRSRQEKMAARESRFLGIPSFLPQYEKSMRRLGRTRTAYLPLFTGYLFFRGGLDSRSEMLRTDRCVRILEVRDQDSLDSDLKQIRRLQLAGVPLVSHPEVKVGDTVRIAEGPFEGISGVIVRERGETRLVVTVRFINKFVSVELDRVAVVLEPATRGSSA
jgi:transcriptional antiterminator RfaH